MCVFCHSRQEEREEQGEEGEEDEPDMPETLDAALSHLGLAELIQVFLNEHFDFDSLVSLHSTTCLCAASVW